MSDLVDVLREADAALRAGRMEEARQRLARARGLAGRVVGALESAEGGADRYRLILERTVHVALARGLVPVAASVLDGMIAIVAARRGFVGVATERGWRFVVSRNIAQSDVENPESHVSTTIIRDVLARGEVVLADDAAGDEFAGRASVGRLALRSVLCCPLVRDGRTIGFVYLDDAESTGLFDDAAVAAVTSWLPYVAEAVARAADEEAAAPTLPGVVTRSARMRAELGELARASQFDAPVLLTGETGTGKSLIARALHQASARARRPFVHVNCGAIPENLIESELFGHRRGSFTGATADRAGHFETAEGGTLFLDELDSMPMACQVKLLVVLQERKYTPVGGVRPVVTDVRVIAAMGADPFDAIDAGKLREDLYYRLAVFVARLPSLRERPEDVPLLARHFLQETRTRYGLPPLRLGERALDELLAHPWPGNVRELANTLDRAALLSKDGVIETISFRARRRGPDATTGLLERVRQVARSFVEAAAERPALRTLDAADVFRSLVLLETLRASGGLEEGLAALGLESLVKNRNHTRTVRREVERVRAVAALLGEAAPADLEPPQR